RALTLPAAGEGYVPQHQLKVVQDLLASIESDISAKSSAGKASDRIIHALCHPHGKARGLRDREQHLTRGGNTVLDRSKACAFDTGAAWERRRDRADAPAFRHWLGSDADVADRCVACDNRRKIDRDRSGNGRLWKA